MILPVNISDNWSIVSLSTLLFGLTTTAIPSKPTINSTGLILFFFAFSISCSFIFLDADAISQLLLIKPAIPVPEPPPVTAIKLSELVFINSSAHD